VRGCAFWQTSKRNHLVLHARMGRSKTALQHRYDAFSADSAEQQLQHSLLKHLGTSVICESDVYRDRGLTSTSHAAEFTG
jgi:hypothetical protein